MVKPRLPPSLQATEAECNGPGVAVIELSGEESSAPAEPTLRSLGLPQPDFHAVILDFSSLNFVDTVSIKIVKNIFRDFREIEVDVFVASCPGEETLQSCHTLLGTATLLGHSC